MEMRETKIPALDKFELGALLLEPSEKSKGVIQFHPGTVTKKEFYLPFCEFLSNEGYTVILFDYRGIGQSRPESLKNFNAKITDWGTLDMAGVLNWSNENFPDQKKYIVAHSMGGQVLGLMNNHESVDGIVTIASSYGNWKNYTGMNKYLSGIMWFTYMAFAPQIFGYLPLKRIDKGEDLPKGVSNELWSWCIGNKAHSEIMEKKNITHYYNEIEKPFKAYFIEDDNIATNKVIPHYKTDFNNTELDIEIIKPNELGVSKIGHYGFFKDKFKETLWANLAVFLDGLEKT